MVHNNILQVTAGVLGKDGKFLIAKRKKDDVLGGLWEFPGGQSVWWAVSFNSMGENAYFWTATEHTETEAEWIHLISSHGQTSNSYNQKQYGYSVRCVAD